MSMKLYHCNTCHVDDVAAFIPSRNTVCRECFKKWTHSYEKSPKGFIMRLYRNMESRVTGVQKAKFHLYEGKELLSRESFYEWAFNSEEFKTLFREYEASGYDRKLAPSVDRMDSKLGYIIGNIEFITMSENSRRGNQSKHAQKKEALLNKAA